MDIVAMFTKVCTKNGLVFAFMLYWYYYFNYLQAFWPDQRQSSWFRYCDFCWFVLGIHWWHYYRWY